MKRIFSVFLSLAMVLAVFVPFATVQADEPSVSVLYPADGDVIGNEQCEVSVETSSAEETVYEFDGEIIDSPVLTPDMLTIGNHKLCVYAISSDGDVSSETSNFTVQKNINNTRLETGFDGLTSALLAGDNPYVYQSANIPNVRMMRQPAQAHSATLSIVEGPEGEGDIAINATSAVKFSSSKPYFNIDFIKLIDTVAVYEHDVMVNDTATVLQYELKASNNKSWYPIDSKNHPMSAGKFFSGEYTYEAGAWYHIKTVFDFGNRTINAYATKHGSDEEMHVLENQTMMADGIDLKSIRCLYYSSSANSGYSIDNISVREETQFGGIDAFEFYYGEEMSEDVYPDANALTAVGIVLSEKITAADVTSFVEIIEKDGNKAQLSSVTFDADTNTIVATVESALDANSEYFVRVGLGAVYSGETLDTDIMEAGFKTAADSYDVNSVGFSVDGTKLITKNQLSGKKLKADIGFSNSKSEDENLAVVLSVRNGDKLVGISLTNVTVPAGSTEYSVEAETALLPASLEDVTIKVMYVDSLQTRKPVFSTYEMKY